MERKERRHHAREFKLEAVRLAAVGDKTKAKVARELSVRVKQLRQWRDEQPAHGQLRSTHCAPLQSLVDACRPTPMVAEPCVRSLGA